MNLSSSISLAAHQAVTENLCPQVQNKLHHDHIPSDDRFARARNQCGHFRKACRIKATYGFVSIRLNPTTGARPVTSARVRSATTSINDLCAASVSQDGGRRHRGVAPCQPGETTSARSDKEPPSLDAGEQRFALTSQVFFLVACSLKLDLSTIVYVYP